MQTQTKFFISVILILLIVIGFSLHNSSQTETVLTTGETQLATEDEKMEAHPTTETNTELGEAAADSLEIVGDASLGSGTYTTYSPEAVANSKAQHIVLNFSATWCPGCRALDKNLTENAASIPDGVEIYKVDYDTYVDLRQKYGITTQHTLVVVNPDGSMIKKWSGGTTLDGVLSQL